MNAAEADKQAPLMLSLGMSKAEQQIATENPDIAEQKLYWCNPFPENKWAYDTVAALAIIPGTRKKNPSFKNAIS